MAAYLFSGSSVALQIDGHPTIAQIAHALVAAGLRIVRLNDLKLAAIKNALVAHDGNRTHAAQSLGISVRTLQRTLKSTPIDNDSPLQSRPELEHGT